LHFHFLWPAENLRSSGGIHDLGRANYLFIIVVIRYDTAATAHWTLMFIVRAFINHTITVAVWTRFSFHGATSVLLQGGMSHPEIRTMAITLTHNRRRIN
jgi:hypothetical protein